VPHVNLGLSTGGATHGLRLLKPEHLKWISHPSEWTFAQLKAAALLTLDIQVRALRRGMSLKDASAFNVQFVGTRPIFIDTLSFTRSAGDGPWVAYRQFCEHFLAPLALVSRRGAAAFALWQTSLDGVALPEASAWLPRRSWLQPGVLMHVHLHARAGASDRAVREPAAAARRMSGFALRLAESLQAAVNKLEWVHRADSNWSGYRGGNTYSQADAAAKADFVRQCSSELQPSHVLDLGANDGLYSALLAREGIDVMAVESDAMCCEQIFRMAQRDHPKRIGTLRIDLTNPTPGYGWAGMERAPFDVRIKADLVLALALVHHLSIGRHVPFARIATWLAGFAPDLVVEYVPTDDPMAARLLAARRGGVDLQAYGEEAFVHAFAAHFETLRRSGPVAGGRVLFWMRRRSAAE
jgi:hypothetical protein